MRLFSGTVAFEVTANRPSIKRTLNRKTERFGIFKLNDLALLKERNNIFCRFDVFVSELSHSIKSKLILEKELVMPKRKFKVKY